MSIILHLPPELETRLAKEASKEGISLADYLLRVLSNGGTQASQVSSGAKLVEYWQQAGIVGARNEVINSQQHARNIRTTAERRERP